MDSRTLQSRSNPKIRKIIETGRYVLGLEPLKTEHKPQVVLQPAADEKVSQPSWWNQRFHKFQKAVYGRFLDVHIVTTNLLQWKSDITQRTNFYCSDYAQDKFFLGVGVAAYTVPYLTVRMAWEGVNNSYEYASFRLTGKTLYLCHNKNRSSRDHKMGFLVSTPIITTLAVTEAGIRLMGFTKYGRNQLDFDHMLATNYVQHYTKKTFSPAEIAAQQKLLKAPAITAWDKLDRVALLPRTMGLAEKGIVGTAYGVLVGAEKLAGLMDVIQTAMAKAVDLSVQAFGWTTGFTLNGWTPYARELILRNNFQTQTALQKHFKKYERRYNFLNGQGARQNLLIINEEIHQLEAKLHNLTPNHFNLALVARCGNAIARGIDAIDLNLYRSRLAAESILGFTEYGNALFQSYQDEILNLYERFGAEPRSNQLQQATLSILTRRAETALDSLDHVTSFGPRLVGNLLIRLPGYTFYLPMRAVYEMGNLIKKGLQWIIENVELILQTIMRGIKTALTFALKFPEGIGRAIGFSEYGEDVVRYGDMRTQKMLARYLLPIDQVDLKTLQLKLKQSPQNMMELCSQIALFPRLLSFIEYRLVAPAFWVGLHLGEAAFRTLGFSDKTLQLYSATGSMLKNMYGLPASSDFPAQWQTIKSLQSPWDIFNFLGLGLNASLLAVVTLPASLPAGIGLSKSNYHRVQHFRHKFHNDLKERRKGQPEEKRTLEDYHQTALVKCESTPLGYAFSQYNVLNLTENLIEAALKYAVAPMVYAAGHILYNGFGLFPLLNACCSPSLDVRKPFDRIKQHFKNLHDALDVWGELPKGNSRASYRETILIAAEEAHDRKWLDKIIFGVASELRKIFTLGHSIEENVLAEFERKFRIFANQCKKQGITHPYGFFTKRVNLEDGERFSFEEMLKNIQGYFPLEADKKRVLEVAKAIKADIDREILGITPGFQTATNESYSPAPGKKRA